MKSRSNPRHSSPAQPTFQIFRKILALIAGLISGGLTVLAMESVSVLVHPKPAGLEMSNREAMTAYVATLPPSAFLIVLIAHITGAFVAGFVCAAIMRRFWLIGCLLLGVFFLLAGIVNLIFIPHPFWFAVVDLLLYIPVTVSGGIVGGKLFARTAGPARKLG